MRIEVRLADTGVSRGLLADTPAATEFVGNGSWEFAGLEMLQAGNPCVRLHDREPGYVCCTATPVN